MEAPPGTSPLLFDSVQYDYNGNYSPDTGVYTVQYGGLYLIHARVSSSDYDARHYIRVNEEEVIFTRGYDPEYEYQGSATSIVIHLKAGDTVSVDPYTSGTISGFTDYMGTTFGITLLYAD